jgi:hypothetical protein
VGFGKDIFYNCSPCGFGKSFGMLLWKRQTQVACHALEKAKGTHAFGKGMWVLEKTSFIIVAPVALEKALACSANLWHVALEKAIPSGWPCLGKGKRLTYALGKASGSWKRLI